MTANLIKLSYIHHINALNLSSKEYIVGLHFPRNQANKNNQFKLCFRLVRKKNSNAVKGMLPKTKLGSKMFTRLKVYAGPEHPHEAQNPQPFPFK